MTNLDSVLKTRDITLLRMVCIVKAMFFPVVMNGCENGMVKKAEHQRTDAFKLWCWRRHPKVAWTARSNQSILKGNQPWILIERTDAEAEAPVFWSSNVNSQLIRKVPDAGKDWGQKEKGHQRMRWLDGITDAVWTWTWAKSGRGEGQGSLACCSPWGQKESDTTEQQQQNHSSN